MVFNTIGLPYSEAFYQQVKQILENFYDFPYLNRHALAKAVQLPRVRSSETDGQRLRRIFLAAIDDLKPFDAVEGRSIQGRFHRLLRLRYVDSNTMQEVARLLGVSERQAYRDLKRAEENLATLLWAQLGSDLDIQIGEGFAQTEAGSSGVPPGASSPAEDAAGELQGLVLHLTNVSAWDLLKNAHKAVERLAAQREITLEIHYSAAPVQLYTDPSLAQQMLISILSNIVQHAVTHRVTIQMVNAEHGLQFVFTFEQTGDPPYPQSASPVIDMLLKRLDWRMSLISSPGIGETTIALHVPVQETILLVIDDNNAIIELLRRYLNQTRCQVVGVDNGIEGLQMAQSLKPDAVLLDVMMPNIDGWEVLQRLRANQETSNIPVIVCSIFNDPGLARSLGTEYTLGKPINRAELLALLERLHLV